MSVLATGSFMPHGFCYLWNMPLVWLHVVSDSLIALAYFAIPLILLWFVRKRRDLPFSWMFVLFGVFIVACGSTHLIEVWNLWHADYWFAGVVKAITAAASVPTAILLARLMPEAIDLPSVGQWAKANALLEKEVRDRRDIELDLRIREATYREHAALLDLTHDAMFVRTIEGKIAFWNRAAEQLYGWRAEDVRGKVPHEILQTEFPKPLAEIDAEVYEKGFWEGELIHQRRDRTRVTVLSRWALRRDLSGKPEAILESNRDITLRKQEEGKFRNLLESAPDAMVIVDGTGRIQLVNAQTEKLFGYSRAELIGQPVEVLVPPRFQQHHVEHRQGYSHLPRTRSMGAGLELYGRRKNGTEFPVEISLSPLETPEGAFISSAIRDITDRKRAESRFRNLLESAPDAIVIVDGTGHIQLVNAQTEKLFGYARAEMIGQPVEMLVPSRYRNQHAGHRHKYSESPRPRAMGMGLELYGIRKDGVEFPVEISLSPLETEEGTLLSSAIRDVSDRRRVENEVRKLNSELQHRVSQISTANEELESFTYSVSHDLRAPLRHIDGFARILKEEFASSLPEEGLQYLDRVLKAANDMGRLVDDLLNLARIGRKEVARQNVNLDELVHQVIAAMESEIKDRQIEWRIEPLGKIECDPGLAKLALSNLLSNAAKFTRTRASAVIEIGTIHVNGAKALFVRDNGVGFDPKYADKLFGVFQRLHHQDEFEGTGIGLATVRRIVRRHGGDIRADSEPGHSTTFTFTLGPQPDPVSATSGSVPSHSGGR